MTVKIIATGETKEYDEVYAIRLIEQGLATTDIEGPHTPPSPAASGYTLPELSSMIEQGSYVHVEGNTLTFTNPIAQQEETESEASETVGE